MIRRSAAAALHWLGEAAFKLGDIAYRFHWKLSPPEPLYPSSPQATPRCDLHVEPAPPGTPEPEFFDFSELGAELAHVNKIFCCALRRYSPNEPPGQA